MNISDQTGIGLGIVFTLLAASATSGMLWQRVADMRKELHTLKTDMKDNMNMIFRKIDTLQKK